MTIQILSQNDFAIIKDISAGSIFLSILLFLSSLMAYYFITTNQKSPNDQTTYELIDAALQIRHTIEKLVSHLPLYEEPWRTIGRTRIGNLWARLWKQIWDDAEDNVDNAFYELRQKARSDFELGNLNAKGKRLYADMSALIHGWDRKGWTYPHFDGQTQALVELLRPKSDDGDEELKRFWHRPGGVEQKLEAKRNGKKKSVVELGTGTWMTALDGPTAATEATTSTETPQGKCGPADPVVLLKDACDVRQGGPISSLGDESLPTWF